MYPVQATRGSISHGTLRTQDLLRACADCLESLAGDVPDPVMGSGLVSDAREWAERIGAEDPTPQDQDTAYEILCDISDKLQDFAPDGCYFGMHPGDGSDLGFWESEF